MHAPQNLFQHRKSPVCSIERALLWAIRLGTYLVLVAAAVIFLDIGIKGGRTVLSSHWPFVNVPFLTEKPSTLYVFEWQGKPMELSDSEFRAFKAANHADNIEAASYAYSAGGIYPCIVGTVLLVSGAMAIALFLGVCSAIYLSEYSRQGFTIRLIRQAIMNLAGVPSIVYGLFGVGLFVIYFK